MLTVGLGAGFETGGVVVVVVDALFGEEIEVLLFEEGVIRLVDVF